MTTQKMMQNNQVPPYDPSDDAPDPPVLVYYIFENPPTAPTYWVTVPTLVRGEAQEAFGEAVKVNSLEAARQNVPNRERCKRFPRNPTDPPELVEAWIEVDGLND